MMPKWDEMISCMGRDETSPDVVALLKKIDGSITISETPLEYGDNLNHTKYYQFHDAGIECGIRHEKISYLTLFVEAHDGYRAYEGEIAGKKRVSWNIEEVKAKWGIPDEVGGDVVDPLLGYISSWIKYVFDDYAVHMEFTKQKKLWRLTLLSI
ncbi:hypothetical protein J2S30_000057 [Herbaspirillum rubrisubalbicans]|uniref:hypothetical protein n=1 Tax=Herbaspirillum rubrisubalbicans TaxID=80842 RepID=UPI00209FD564|nr:hypothetical protein [Herbaspirillum rubrisubalbicans]MCP1571678.1 hypothetical protein [Herbaspirillum rubrisubalbicans]